MDKKYLLIAAGVGLFLFMNRSEAGQNPSAPLLGGLLGGSGSNAGAGGTQPASNDGMMYTLPYEESDPIKTDGGTTVQPPPSLDYGMAQPLPVTELPDYEPDWAVMLEADMTAQPATDFQFYPPEF